MDEFDDPDFLRRLAICVVIMFSLLGYWLYTAGYGAIQVPWEVECFFEEYGPIMLDLLLALPLVSSLRRLRTRIGNRDITQENRRAMLLELPDELILQICDWVMVEPCPRKITDCDGHPPSKKALSELAQTNKRMRHLLAPVLFRSLLVCNRTWWRADRACSALQNSSHAHHATKELRIYFYNIGREDHKYPNPPKAFPQSTAKILADLSFLTRLTFNIPFDLNPRFRTVYQNRNLVLPSVTTLLLSPYAHWLISHCPNVHTIAADIQTWPHATLYDRDSNHLHVHTFHLIRSASRAPHLHHFEVFERTWETCLQEILKAMPHLHTLGQITGSYEGGISNLLPILSRFEDLRTLVLADIQALRVGFDPPGCGNVYMGPGGAEYRKRVEEWGRNSMAKVAREVFGAVKGLREVWVGDHDKAVVRRGQGVRGGDEIVWFRESRKV